jgi:hypothetical protein
MPVMIPPTNRPNVTYGTITADPITGVMVLECDVASLASEGWTLSEILAAPIEIDLQQDTKDEE